MSEKKAAAKKAPAKAASKNVAPLTTADVPTTKAGREKDAEEQPPTFRVDLGESLPTPPIPTATDNE